MNDNPPKDLQSTQTLLSRAYPVGIPREDYYPLLSLMKGTRMSDRAVAESLGLFYGKPYQEYLYDVGHNLPNMKIAKNEIDRVKKLLVVFGYDTWAEED